MGDQREGKGAADGGAAGGGARAAAGKSTRVAARYPSPLAQAARAQLGDRADRASVDDVATVAVDGKDAGRAMAAEVAGPVGAHLGHDFSTVRVHDDPLAREATAAMGARAFAHGGDVFLGPGESDRDLGLMAHELTHVAQQGAAAATAPQRQVAVGAANSPAETEADAVASQVTAGQARPAALLVDDGPVQPGQMLKSTFIEVLHGQVTAAATEELGPLQSAIGCPYIDQYFARYGGQPASAGEQMLRRFAPASRGVASAEAMIPIVVARVRDGIRHWRTTGEPPPELAAADPAAAGAATSAAPTQAAALRAPDGRATLASLEADLGPGQALDASVAARMGSALDADLGAVRVHTDERAARKADAADARAFAVGEHVVMGAGEYRPGTIEGDALLAHELAHTVQQAGASGDPVARRQPIEGESAAAEADADGAAVGVLGRLWGGLTGGGAKEAGDARPNLTGTLSLQRCGRDTPAPAPQQAPQGPQVQPGPQPSQQPAPSGTPQVPAAAPAIDPWVQSMIDVMGAQDRDVIRRIIADNVRIVRFTTAWDTWRYDDGRVVRDELTTLRGNTDPDTGTIRIRSSLPRDEAAVTLFHEMNHWGRPATTTRNQYLDEEVDVRVQSELFAIRHGFPETRPGYRNTDGTVNRANIRSSVYNSSHYNPTGRTRIDRTYDGDQLTSGWYVPTTP